MELLCIFRQKKNDGDNESPLLCDYIEFIELQSNIFLFIQIQHPA